MCTYVCMYVCMYVCPYPPPEGWRYSVQQWAHTHTYIMSMYIFLCIHIYTHAYIESTKGFGDGILHEFPVKDKNWLAWFGNNGITDFVTDLWWQYKGGSRGRTEGCTREGSRGRTESCTREGCTREGHLRAGCLRNTCCWGQGCHPREKIRQCLCVYSESTKRFREQAFSVLHINIYVYGRCNFTSNLLL